jgi:hypothetical protein
MPKPFLIGIEVEEVALGLVMRKLNSLPGVVKLHMDLDLIGPKAKPNGTDPHGKRRGRPPGRPHRTFDMTGEQAIIAMLKGKTMSIGEMKDVFAAQGRAPGSVNSCLFKVQKQGAVVRTGPNAYALAKTKSKTKPKPKPKNKPKNKPKPKTPKTKPTTAPEGA